jgi:excisionase family DNA binding protein
VNERIAFSVQEVCDLTGLSRPTLYAQMGAGKLAYLKVGRRRLITRAAVDDFLRQETPTALVNSA